MAGLHRQGLRPGAGQLLARPSRSAAGRRPSAPGSTNGAGCCRGRWPARRISRSTGDRLEIAIPLPASVARRPALFLSRSTTARSIMPRRRRFRRNGDTLIAELKRKRGEPARFAGVLALGDGARARIQAPSRAQCPSGGTADRRARTPAPLCWAMLGALAGGLLLNLMPCVFPILALKALHLARAGGDEREARRDALAYAAGAVVGTGALGGIAAGDPRRGKRGRLGIPAAGPAHDHRPAAAGDGDHAQPAAGVRAAGARRRARVRPAASGPARSPPSSQRPAPGHSSARRSARRCCCRSTGRSRSSPRSAWAWPFPFLLVAFVPALRDRLPQARALDGPAAAHSSPFRWRRRQSAACGCSIGRAGRGADVVGSLPSSRWRLCCSWSGGGSGGAAGSASSRWRCRRWSSATAVAKLPAAVGDRHACRRGAEAVERGGGRRYRRARASRCSSISPPTGA